MSTRRRKQRRAARRKAVPRPEAPAARAPEPLSDRGNAPPLEGAALREALVAQLVERMRSTAARQTLREACRADDVAIESALADGDLLKQLRVPVRAYVIEQGIEILQSLVAGAQMRQATPTRFLIEMTALGKLLGVSLDAEQAAEPLYRAAESSLLRALAELTPPTASDTPAEVAELPEAQESGEEDHGSVHAGSGG
jgi:hypothetical protein